ncbi:MAG TPA: hypothetical protein VFD70_15875 [Anaerolineae bacterium]|nr:hypothetical protein [Anaerolineae bacterium]
MAQLIKPGYSINNFKIIELAGDGTQSNVYLAEREGKSYWLVQIEAPTWEPNVGSLLAERFVDKDGGKWVAIPTSGTNIVNLAAWVDRLELRFIGWRWARLASGVGFTHRKGAVLQRAHLLSLARLVFNTDGELLFLQGASDAPEAYSFAPPESVEQSTSASDVYALGASLKAILGEPVPGGVQTVLRRATDPDPKKRYADAAEFSHELALALPKPPKPARPPLPRWAYWVMAAIVIMLVAYVVLGIELAAVFIK